VNPPKRLQFTVETVEIESGRTLRRYSFEEVEAIEADREDKGEIVDPSAVGPDSAATEG